MSRVLERDERGYVILVAGLVVMLALLLPAGVSVIVEHANLVTAAKRSQDLVALRGHESLTLRVNRNVENTVIITYNTGSVQSAVHSLLIKNLDNSLTVDEDLGLNDNPVIYVNILDNRVFTENRWIDENRKIGVLTSLGNTYWEE